VTSSAQELVPLRRSPLLARSIDNTALSSYMACPRRFYYSMIANRRHDGAGPPALSYGSAWHKAMEVHYKSNGDQELVRYAVVQSWEPHSRPDDHRTLDRVLLEYKNYLRMYGATPEIEAANWGRTVGWPENPLVEIPTEVIWPEALHPYAGKIDRVIEWQGLFYVEDHKTTSQLGPYFFRQFDPDNQMMGYSWMAHLLTGLPIQGVRINAHCILKGSSKFERQLVTYDFDRLREWAGENYNYWIRRIETDLANASILMKPGDLVPPATAFGHNFSACHGKYGACAYVGVCTMPPRLRQRVLEAEFADRPWDPMHAVEEGGADA